MIVSMTGFSTKTTTIKDKDGNSLSLNMTLKSLNSRFFECNFKLPFILSSLEADLLKFFRSKLIRGNIYFSVTINNLNSLNFAIEPSLNVVSSYINAINSIKAKFNKELSSEKLNINELIKLPNIFENQEKILDQDTKDKIVNEIKVLVDSLNKEREKEGKALKKDLKDRIKLIKSYLEKIEPRTKVIIKEKKESIKRSLSQILTEQEYKDQKSKNLNNMQNKIEETQDLLIYHQLEKMDINEELVRFKAHLENLSSLLNSKSVQNGKKIDFTLQELFREINTITSKCSDALISSIAIDIKVEIEKAREQTQNII